MRILGFESSCDETGVAIYHAEHGLLSHALHSQIAVHNLYGGVVPEIASRDHIQRIVPLTRLALHQANLRLEDIDLVAYTAGPGLAGALLVGATFAESLAYGLGKPVMPINHLEGHVLSPMLAEHKPSYPYLTLLVSGGHTQIILVEQVGRYVLLGESLDDAAGEAFDKSAKMLGLGYPGGAKIAALAAEATAPSPISLPRPLLDRATLAFSFSGLKTAVRHAIDKLKRAHDNVLPEPLRASLANEIQAAIIDVLISKCTLALTTHRVKHLAVVGGVSANHMLRARLDTLQDRHDISTHYPPLEFCTDNGAMIALTAAWRGKHFGWPTAQLQNLSGYQVHPRWPLIDMTTDGSRRANSTPDDGNNPKI